MKHWIFLGCSWLIGGVASAPKPHDSHPSTSKPPTKASAPAKDPAKAPAKAPPKAPARAGDDPQREVDRLVADIQAYYDRMEDYTADFIQTYTRVALSRTSESRGQLMLKKPGMMRWTYKSPAPKLWVADGKQLFVYDEEEGQVFVDRDFEMSKLSNSVSFLWGEGKLTDSFKVSLANAAMFEAPANAKALELIPKQDATYARLVLIVAPGGGEVTESILFETSGNKNHFRFTNAKLNRGLKAEDFHFTPPPGVEVIHRSP
ncbi:MAG: outer membrane lipoprotein carrier protein LolA [Deltaproteobacteria bacterium]|nr:outer membrane lipoprotein carrier protein LolA [Deltaproteobacteria bacterium]